MKKSIKEVGIVYINDTNLWAGIEDDDGLLSATQKGQEGVDRWGGSLQALGGTFQPLQCTWTSHDKVQNKKENGSTKTPQKRREKKKRKQEKKRRIMN